MRNKPSVLVTSPRYAKHADNFASFLKNHLGCKLLVSATSGFTMSCEKHKPQHGQKYVEIKALGGE